MKKNENQVKISNQETVKNIQKEILPKEQNPKPANKEETENKKNWKKTLDYITKPPKAVVDTIVKSLKSLFKVLSSNTVGMPIAIAGFVATVATGGTGAIAIASVIMALKTAQSGISVYKNYKTNQMIAEQEALIEYATARSTQQTLKNFSSKLQNIKSLSTNKDRAQELKETKNFYGKKMELIENLIDLANLATSIATLNPKYINTKTLSVAVTIGQIAKITIDKKEQIEDFIKEQTKNIQAELKEVINEERKNGYTVSYQDLKDLNEKTRQMEKENLALKDLLKNHDIDKTEITKEKLENQFKQILATKKDKDIKTPVKKYSRLGFLVDSFVDDLVLKEIEIKKNTGITKGQRKNTEQQQYTIPREKNDDMTKLSELESNIQKTALKKQKIALKKQKIALNQQKKHNIAKIQQNGKNKGSAIRK